MNDKRILRNIGVSMVMKPISMLLGLVYTPLALSFLGDEKYGVWAIILNIVSWINYFDIGIGNGLRNKLTEAITLNDEEAAKKYVSTAYVGTTIISMFFCIIITLVWRGLDLCSFFNLTLADENTDDIIFFSIMFVCINFVLSLSKTSAYAIQQPGLISVVGVLGQALQVGLIIAISTFMKRSLMSVSLVYGTVGLFDSILLFCIVTRKRPYLRPSISSAKKEYFRPLLTLGAGFFALQISSLVLNTTDNLLVSNLYGSADVTPYNTVFKAFNMIVQIHAIIILPMWSAYNEAATRRDISWIKNTMRRINRISFCFTGVASIGIVLFRPVSRIWLGRDLNYGKGLILLVALYTIAQLFGNNYSSFLCGVGHIKASIIISVIGALLNIPLSVIFARHLSMRLNGIILGSLVVMLISTIVLPIVAHRWINAKTKEWCE